MTRRSRTLLVLAMAGSALACAPCALAARAPAAAAPVAGDPADARAAALVAQMTPDELGVLVHGAMAISFGGMPVPAEAVPGAGYIPGIARLGLPALKETDASLGVSWADGVRHDGATALPSGAALAASFDPDLLRAGGAMIGGEARAKGFNVMLAGGVNLVREPRGGRTFEYLGEDPWLAGTLAGASIAGIQSNHMVSTVKHYALNDQETGRQFANVRLSESAARASDLLAFQVAIERGQPGSVMCSYNRIDGASGCGNDHLLNGVLKGDWAYKGWVMSDWGAVHGLEYALAGLDQQSGEQIDSQVWFGAPLRAAASQDARYAARLRDMNQRIVRSLLVAGLDAQPAKGPPVDAAANAAVAERAALEGAVLLRNERGVLPLDAGQLHRIAVIGGYADSGVLSGAGSTQVHGEGGAALVRPGTANGMFASLTGEQYQRSNPLRAIEAQAPGVEVLFRNGRHIADAVALARRSDVAIVFATQHMSEGFDVPDLALPDGQDGLIAAVAAANPRTIVVLETGGPVLMPWLAQVPAVLEAWYPGARGGEAIARLLFGKANPSGRLAITFPASEAQLPRPVLPGIDTIEPDFIGSGKPGQSLELDYDIEGADVGYRWHARQGTRPLFAFGHGLSYTTFDTGNLRLLAGRQQLTAEATVRNTGARAGAEVVQLYLASAAGQATRRLVAYQRVELAPGESRNVVLAIDPRLLGRWEGGAWHVAAGAYRLALGRNALELGPEAEVALAARSWLDPGRAAAAEATASAREGKRRHGRK